MSVTPEGTVRSNARKIRRALEAAAPADVAAALETVRGVMGDAAASPSVRLQAARWLAEWHAGGAPSADEGPAAAPPAVFVWRDQAPAARATLEELRPRPLVALEGPASARTASGSVWGPDAGGGHDGAEAARDRDHATGQNPNGSP